MELTGGAHQETDDKAGGEKLGEDRGQGRAANPHVKEKDQHRIKDQVGHGADENGQHSRTGIALCVDERRHAGGDHGGRCADQIHRQIQRGMGEHLLGCAKQTQSRRAEQFKKSHENDGCTENQRKRRIHDGFRFLPVPPSPGDGAQRGTADTEKVGKSGNDHNDGETQPDAPKAQGSLTGNPANVNAVYNAVQQVQQLGDQHGQC